MSIEDGSDTFIDFLVVAGDRGITSCSSERLVIFCAYRGRLFTV